MTKYLQESFSVNMGGSQQYRDNWDAIFAKPKTMTKREVFDKVKTHMLTQKRVSVHSDDTTLCAYRGYDSLKCAAGCLIADEHYTEGLEGVGISSFDGDSVWNAIVASGVSDDPEIRRMVTELQRLHDTAEPAVWAECLDELERKYFG